MIKGGHVMETLPQVNCFAFDKTGTLTTGEFSIVDVTLFSKAVPYSQTDILSIAAALESHSEHPIAKPFAKYRSPQWLANNVIVHSGRGITATINDKQFAIGKSSWLITHPDYITSASDEVSQADDASCLLMVNGVIIAAFYLVDKTREEAKATLSALNKTNNNTLLLSGDSQSACDTISNTLPIKECIGGLSAEAKMQKIKQVQQQGYKVAMTGDGVNDSPVLGSAHVSIAMGCGADITKSGADVILLNNKLSSINTLIEIAHRTRRIIFQNYLWAFGYNAIVLPLAVTGYITPYMAVIGMSASSILVISNSLRLLKR
jgi:Cu2+-exporting ATPase